MAHWSELHTFHDVTGGGDGRRAVPWAGGVWAGLRYLFTPVLSVNGTGGYDAGLNRAGESCNG